jgi:hypothetical protein
MTFEQAKQERMRRNPRLRFLNATGMISWEKVSNNYANPKLRRVHPFTWVFTLLLTITSVLIDGIPATWYEIPKFWKNDTKWW